MRVESIDTFASRCRIHSGGLTSLASTPWQRTSTFVYVAGKTPETLNHVENRQAANEIILFNLLSPSRPLLVGLCAFHDVNIESSPFHHWFGNGASGFCFFTNSQILPHPARFTIFFRKSVFAIRKLVLSWYDRTESWRLSRMSMST